MIARREGLGDILAEGLLRAGEHLGDRAKAHFTPSVSGVGFGESYSPREYITTAMLYALEPRQPMSMLHEVSFLIAHWLLHRLKPELSDTSAEVFRAAATRFWGSDKAWDLTTYEGKALAAVRIQDRSYAKDSLVLCDFAWPIMESRNTPDHVGDPTLESRIFSAVTGIETDEAGLHEYGERIFNLQRGVLLREGWRARDDDLPAEFNFIEPVQTHMLNPELIVPGPTEEPVSVRGKCPRQGEVRGHAAGILRAARLGSEDGPPDSRDPRTRRPRRHHSGDDDKRAGCLNRTHLQRRKETVDMIKIIGFVKRKAGLINRRVLPLLAGETRASRLRGAPR